MPADAESLGLLDTLPCGYVAFRDDGIILRVNQTLARLLEYERDELIGKHVETLFAPGGRVFYQTHVFPLLKMTGAADELYLLLRTKSGTDISTLLNARRVQRGTAFFENECVLFPVQERRKFEDALLRAKREAEEANRAKSAFLAVMSHELRTPLNAIAGYVELIELGIHGPVTDAQHSALDRIKRSQRHLLRLINDVLNLARIEAGHVAYAIEDVALNEVIASVLPMIEPQLTAKNVRFLVEAPPSIVARADRDKTQQILINLLNNAVKFTQAGGKVCVSATVALDAEHVLLRVEDTGIGIPENMLDLVFEAFVQVDVTHTRAAEGTGLGLSISRDLARGMKGELSAESTVGEGSAFTLTLPRAKHD
jgi:PAS domain S-box-containing protein